MSRFPIAKLEDWYRDQYFSAGIDISSSGVQPYTLKQVRQLAQLRVDEIDGLLMCDSRTLGGEGVRMAIAREFSGSDPERIMVTNGSSEAIFLACRALLDEGDEVVMTSPIYHSYQSLAKVIGCSVKVWPLDSSDGFNADLDRLERLVTNRTKAVIVNFPHNPTGVMLSRSDQLRLVSILDRCNAYLIVDAAFAQLIYGDEKLLDFYQLYPKSVTIHTMSKAYGLPGLRVGWAVGPSDLLRECIRLRDFTVLFMSPLLELIAERVVANAEKFVRPRFEQAALNRDYTCNWLSSYADSVNWVKPAGGVTVFCRFKGIADVDNFCTEVLREKDVLLCPGSCFGEPEYIRIGFGEDRGMLEEGLGRLAELLDSKGIHRVVAVG